MLKKRFAGKTVAITGGARGIGRAIAKAFAREGASVHVVDATPGDRFVGDIADPDAAQQPVGRVGRPEGISPPWRCSSAPTKPGSSPAKISARTAA